MGLPGIRDVYTKFPLQNNIPEDDNFRGFFGFVFMTGKLFFRLAKIEIAVTFLVL